MPKLRNFVVAYRDTDHCKRLSDPYNEGAFHLELLLPFTEADKLVRGNANVRPPSEKKHPVREMEETVDSAPESFHLKNRGITYLCERFENDNASKRVTIQIPDVMEGDLDLDGTPRFGVADGGHTLHVIQKTTAAIEDFRKREEWVEPFVRVHLLSGRIHEMAPEIVEALNTSTQVKQVTLDEYQGEFEELKGALQRGGFDIDVIAFRENEDKEWTVEEILQRLACFLKDRWQDTPPASIYKSKGKALDLYIDKKTREEFRRLFDIIGDIVALPEFLESEISRAGVKGRPPRAVKVLKKQYVRPGTSYATRHRLDTAAVLPMASAFRELLQLKGDRYHWRLHPREVYPRAAESLYKALLRASRDNGSVSQLGSDTEYWKDCSQAVMRAFTDIREEKFSALNA
jgi:hypothetical protein